MKWINATERLPDPNIDVTFRDKNDKKGLDVHSYWSDTHLELNDADLLGKSVGTLFPKTEIEWLEE